MSRSLLLLLFLLPACGGGDADTTGSDNPTAASQTTVEDDGADQDPTAPSGGAGDVGHTCDLITAAEVSAAVGFEVGEGGDYLATAPGATQCEWPGTVYAEVLTEGGRDWFESVHFGEPAFEEVDVPGLGDEALYSEGLGLLDAVSGDIYVAVQIIGARFAGIDALTAGTALVEAILAKLE
jgi:hypothetical protein